MSRTSITSLICNNFSGIKKRESSFSDESISCSSCQNVELYYTNQNSGVGIRTSKGNTLVHSFEGQEIVGLFESNQGGKEVVFAYTEDIEYTEGYRYGHIWVCDILLGNYDEKILSNPLYATGMACATDFTSGYNDYFVFSNGSQLVFLYTDANPEHIDHSIQEDPTIPVSVNGDTVTGLGLAVFDNKLWIFNGHTLYYSYKGIPTDFSTIDADKAEASAGYNDLTKPITAISEYLGSLAVFHKDSSCLVQKDSTTVYSIGDDSPGGCASYDAVVFHGTDLYFYDDTKKGVYGFSQVVNGDKTLIANIAEDIQDELLNIQRSKLHLIRTLSVVTEDRNEVWFIVPTQSGNQHSTIFIFDYLRKEWVKRVSNHINCILVYDTDLYSGGANLYKEYEGETFNGDFIESYYKCSVFNYGTDNTLKITKFPPRITVSSSDTCNFWCEYVRNYDIFKSPKRKLIECKGAGKVLVYDSDATYDSNYIYKTVSNAIAKLPSVTFKALEITFKTEKEGESFNIKNIEFSKLKVKQI